MGFFQSDLFFGIIIGIIMGGLITWQYFEKTKNNSVGRRIENVLLSKNVEAVLGLSQELNELIEKLRFESDELYDAIYRVRDIESMSSMKNPETDDKDDNSSK